MYFTQQLGFPVHESCFNLEARQLSSSQCSIQSPIHWAELWSAHFIIVWHYLTLFLSTWLTTCAGQWLDEQPFPHKYLGPGSPASQISGVRGLNTNSITASRYTSNRSIFFKIILLNYYYGYKVRRFYLWLCIVNYRL